MRARTLRSARSRTHWHVVRANWTWTATLVLLLCTLTPCQGQGAVDPDPPYGTFLRAFRGTAVYLFPNGTDNSTIQLTVGIAQTLLAPLVYAFMPGFLASRPQWTVSCYFTGVLEVAAQSGATTPPNMTVSAQWAILLDATDTANGTSTLDSALAQDDVWYPDLLMTYSEVPSKLWDAGVLAPLNQWFDQFASRTEVQLADNVPVALWLDLQHYGQWLALPFFYDVRGVSVNVSVYAPQGEAAEAAALLAYQRFVAQLPPVNMTRADADPVDWFTPEPVNGTWNGTVARNGRVIPQSLPAVPPLMAETAWYAWPDLWTFEALRDHMDFYASQGVQKPLVEQECMLFPFVVSLGQAHGVNLVNSDGTTTAWDSDDFASLLLDILWPMMRGRPDMVCDWVNCQASGPAAYITQLQAVPAEAWDTWDNSWRAWELMVWDTSSPSSAHLWNDWVLGPAGLLAACSEDTDDGETAESSADRDSDLNQAGASSDAAASSSHSSGRSEGSSGGSGDDCLGAGNQDAGTPNAAALWAAQWPATRSVDIPRGTCTIPNECGGAATLYSGRDSRIQRVISPGSVTAQYSWGWSVSARSNATQQNRAWQWIDHVSDFTVPATQQLYLALGQEPVLAYAAQLPAFEAACQAKAGCANLLAERAKARSPIDPAPSAPMGTFEFEQRGLVERLLLDVFYSTDANLTRRIHTAQWRAVSLLRYLLLDSCTVSGSDGAASDTLLVFADRYPLTRPIWNPGRVNATCRITARSTNDLIDTWAAVARQGTMPNVADREVLGALLVPGPLPSGFSAVPGAASPLGPGAAVLDPGSTRYVAARQAIEWAQLPLCVAGLDSAVTLLPDCDSDSSGDAKALTAWLPGHVNVTCRLLGLPWAEMTAAQRQETGQETGPVGAAYVISCPDRVFGKTTATGLLAWAVLCLCAQAAAFAGLWRWRHTDLLRAGSWRWCLVIAVALVLVSASLILDLGVTTPAQCLGSAAALSFGLASLVAALHVMGFRVYEIFVCTATELVQRKLSDRVLVRRFLLLLGAQALWFGVYAGTTDLGRQLAQDSTVYSGAGSIGYVVCDLGPPGYLASWLCAVLLVLAANVYYAWQVYVRPATLGLSHETTEQFNDKVVTALLTGSFVLALVVFVGVAFFIPVRAAFQLKTVLVAVLDTAVTFGFFGVKFGALRVQLSGSPQSQATRLSTEGRGAASGGDGHRVASGTGPAGSAVASGGRAPSGTGAPIPMDTLSGNGPPLTWTGTVEPLKSGSGAAHDGRPVDGPVTVVATHPTQGTGAISRSSEGEVTIHLPSLEGLGTGEAQRPGTGPRQMGRVTRKSTDLSPTAPQGQTSPTHVLSMSAGTASSTRAVTSPRSPQQLPRSSSMRYAAH